MLNRLLISLTLCIPLVLATLYENPPQNVLSKPYDYIVVGGTTLADIALYPACCLCNNDYSRTWRSGDGLPTV